MSLAEVQRLLAQLYIDAELRERFFVAPEQVGQAAGLTPDEAHQFAQLSARQVSSFAAVLRRKRLKGVARLLPRTHQALGKRFDELFRRHAEAYLPAGHRKQHQDALTFYAYLKRAAHRGGLEPPWALDLAGYEAALLRSAEQRLTVCILRYAVPTLLHQSEAGAAHSPPIKPTIVIWLRLPRRSRPWRLLIPTHWS